MKRNLLITNKGYIYNGGNTNTSLNFSLFQIHGMFGADSCITRDMKKTCYIY